MSFEFKTIAPYVPAQICALKYTYWDKKPGHKKEMLDTALAVAGYFVAAHYACRLGLNLGQVAALTTLVLPNVARHAIGGHCLFYGIKNAIAAGRGGDAATLVKNLALAAIGYFANTEFGFNLRRDAYAKII